MLYVIFARDNSDSFDLRVSVRKAHLGRLQALQDQGRLVLAGPMPLADVELIDGAVGVFGSLIVAEFESLEAAKAWASQDPFTLTGVYADVQVQPFLQIFPDHSSTETDSST